MLRYLGSAFALTATVRDTISRSMTFRHYRGMATILIRGHKLMVQGHVQLRLLFSIVALSDIQMSFTCIRFILALLQI